MTWRELNSRQHKDQVQKKKTKKQLQNILQKEVIASEESSLQCFMCFALSNVYDTVFPGVCFLLWV